MSHNEWVIIVSLSAGSPAVTAIVQALFGWLQSRNGRRFRYRNGDQEWEAPSEKALRRLIRSAGDEIKIHILPPGADQ